MPNYNNNYSRQNYDNRQRSYTNNLPAEIKAKQLPAGYIDLAENVIRGIKQNSGKAISTSKIRNLLSMVSDIYNVEYLRPEKEILSKSQTALSMLRIRVAYEAGRDAETKEFVAKAELLEYIKGIGTSRESLINFSHYMEALVAYHRYYNL